MCEDSTISQTTWNREQQIYLVKTLTIEIQNSIYSRTQLESKIDQLMALLTFIKNQEQVRVDKEAKTIHKYNSTKTDEQFQKNLMFMVLESVLNNYKKLLVQYDKMGMANDRQKLKEDIEVLKANLREKFKNIGGATIAEILQTITMFSRSRLDQTFDFSEKQSMKWRDNFVSEQAMKRVKLQHSRKSAETEVSPRGLYFTRLNPHQNIKLSIFTERLKPSPIDTNLHNTNIMTQERKNLFKKIDHSLQDTEPSLEPGPEFAISPYRITTKQPLFRPYQYAGKVIPKQTLTQLNHMTTMAPNSNSPLNRFPIHIQYQDSSQDFAHYIVHISPKYGEEYHTSNFKSSKEITINDNYYNEQAEELKLLTETEQKINLFKYYKDSLRVNLSIQVGLDQFRRNYKVFLKRSVQPSLGAQSKTKRIWASLQIQQSKIPKVLPLLDPREISRLVQRRNELRSQ